jgi:hypothetical protein
MHDRKTESLLSVLESVILIISAFVLNQLNLVATYVGFVCIPKLIFDLHTYEYNQKPSVDDGVEVEVYGFDNLIFLVFILGYNLYFILLL